MAKSHILVSSGFIIPDNKWFVPIEKNSSYRIQLLAPENSVESDTTLAELINSSSVYSSKACNEAFLNYQHKPSFESYMLMVDLFCEIFAGIDINKYYEIQSRNLYLSPVGFAMLTDFMKWDLHKTYYQYAVAPSFFRMDRKNSYAVLEKRKETLASVKRFLGPEETFTAKIAGLTGNRDAFAAFFKYMLTDSNRGNSYA